MRVPGGGGRHAADRHKTPRAGAGRAQTNATYTTYYAYFGVCALVQAFSAVSCTLAAAMAFLASCMRTYFSKVDC